MKGKTKTILTVIIAILVFAIAVVGTVTFLKDDGEASAAEGTSNVLPVTGSDDEQTNSNGEQNPTENLNGEENPANAENGNPAEETTGGNTQGTTTTGNQGTTTGGNTQTEPEPTVIEQERLVSTTLNWSNISLSSTIGEKAINYTNLGYTIRYYQVVMDKEIVLLNTETGKAEYATTVTVTENQIKENCPIGYKLDETSELSVKITENVDKNVIEVYYVKDESQTHDITYTVKHYIEGEYQEEDDFTDTQSVWVNDTEAEVTYELDEDKYVGYKLDSNDLTETATDGTVFNVYYVKDESQKHDITYTVKHYIEGTYQEGDDFTETKTVWVNDTTIPVTYELDEDKYVGYKLANNDLTETATDGTVFNVYYVKDDSQTKQITYTVKHYIEGTYQEGDDFKDTQSVWVNDTTIPVTYKLNANKYVGYKLANNDLTETATDGKVFSVNYVKDESQKHDITYTVKHYIEGEYQEGDDFTETKTVWINDTTIPVTYKLDENKYVGYKVGSKDLTETATDGKVFSVNYVKDDSQTKQITYTVKHYIEGTHQEGDDFTETKTVWINDTTIPVTYELDEDKYVGYKLDRHDLTETATNGKVFSVNYVKDESQTKQITYTVKHYIEGTHQKGDDFTETKTVWVNDTTIPVTYELNANKYVGYKLDSDDLTKTATDGTVFNVYYVKDQFTYIVKYFYEGIDGEYHEDDTYIPTPISADYEDVITTFEPRTLNDMYVLNHVTPADKDGNAHLVISADETANVLEVYYERNLFGYKVEYYQDSVSTVNKKGETEIAEQKVGTVMTAEIVSDDFGTDWLNAHKPTVGYQDGEVVEYITIQANDSNVIQVVYRPQTNIPYTVEYYFNGEPDTSKNYSGEATFGSQIETVRDYSNNGEWTIDTTKSTTLPFTIAAVSGNVIKVYYVKPDITVVKTRTVNTNRTTGAAGTVEPGETITYTITATNNGYAEGTVNIGDNIPEGTTLVEGTITATGYDTVTKDQLEAGIDLTVPAKTANGAGTASVTFTVTVTAKANNNIVNVPDVNGEKDTNNTVTNKVEKTVSAKSKTQTITNSNIVIVIDTSLSMSYVRCDRDWCMDWNHDHEQLIGSDGKTHTYHKDETMINAAKQVTNEFIDNINLSNDANNIESTVTVIQFDGNTEEVGTATLASQKTSLKNKVLAMQTDSSTNMSTALKAAKNKFSSLKEGNNNIVIFLSDGEPSDKRSDVAKAASELKKVATVYTVGFGADADTNILQNTIASSKDKYFPATEGNYSSLYNAFQQAKDDFAQFELKQSIDALVELTGVYADETHPIKITVNGTPLGDITALPTDKSGYVILENGKYYLDVNKFEATDTITIEYYSNN